MVLGGQATQRQEELGREEQHRQGAFEREPAGHQPDAGLDRDERGGRGRTPFQHERRLERRSQDVHRRRTLSPADLLDRLRLLGAPPEHLQRRQAPQDVQEVGVHPCKLALATFRQVADPSADQREEQHEHGTRDQQDRHRPRVQDEDDGRHHDRDDDREPPRRRVSGDVRIERLDALPGGVDELADPLPAGVGGAERDQRGGQPLPEVDLQAVGGPLCHDLAAPQERASRDQQHGHPDDEPVDRGQRPSVDEDPSDDGRQQQGERDPADDRREGQRRRGRDGASRARVVLPEASFDGAGAIAPLHPPGSGRNARA